MFEDLLQKIEEKMEEEPYNPQLYKDYFAVVCQEDDKRERLNWLSKRIAKAVQKAPESTIFELHDFHKTVVTENARDDFRSYLQAMEWNRAVKKRFYLPRKKQLDPIIDSLQDLADDKLDILGISLPPGTGKSTLAFFFITWLAGRNPDEPILTGSHSNAFIRGAYDECLRLIVSDEYRYKEIFLDVPVVGTNAKDCRIDLYQPKRFDSLQFTSIGAGNAGLYRATQLLYCDDLVSGIEVALSKERLDKLWDTYTADFRQRKLGEKCKELHIATRWSVHDIVGRLERQYETSERARFVSVSALNENGESNFDYKFGVGYTTETLLEQRDIMDDASWRALYMNEPIEREGQLYSESELRRYYELPDEDPDAILAICDTKDRGDDYCVLPIAYQYGKDFYIEDVICDNSKPELVEARLSAILLKHKVKMCRFESNAAGGKIAEKVRDEVKAKGGVTHITTKFTTANKETKIIVNSPYVKEHFLFKADGNKEYKSFLNWLTAYTMMGRNKHDDVPDALSMLAEFVQSLDRQRIEVFARPW